MTDSVAFARQKAVEPGVRFTPDDVIFAQPDNSVNQKKTPETFVGAVLAHRFEIVKYIESGSFGRGWVAHDNARDDAAVFVKTFRSSLDRPSPGNPDTHERMIKKEIELLLAADTTRLPPHPNIVSATEVHYGDVHVPKTGKEGRMFFLVTPDLCEGGELYNYLVFGRGIKRLEEGIARYFAHQIAEGIAHMHHHGVFHRDIKLENIVLDAHYVPKIMDFGHAKFADECQKVASADGAEGFVTQTFVGTSSYQPPELKRDSNLYNPAAFDVWSYGVIVFFLVGIEALAATGNDFTFMARSMRKGGGLTLLDQKRDKTGVPHNSRFWSHFRRVLDISPELKNLLNGIFDLDARKRFTIDQVLAHPWFQQGMPSHDDVIAAMSSRSSGIVERDIVFSLADVCGTQDDAFSAIATALDTIAPYRTHGFKIGVCDPPKFAIAVGESRKVRIMWLTGGLDEWLEFRGWLAKKLDQILIEPMTSA